MRALALLLFLSFASVAVATSGSAHFDSGERWLGSASPLGFNYSGSVCAASGTLVRAEIQLDEFPGRVENGLSTSCADIEVDVAGGVATRPGKFYGNISGTDSSGAHVADIGSITLTVLPREMAGVDGFPDLSALPRPLPPSPISLEFIVGDDAAVKSYRLTWNGAIQADTLAGYVPMPSDRHVLVQAQPIIGTGSFRVDGTQTWTGILAQNGTEWWHLSPLQADGLGYP